MKRVFTEEQQLRRVEAQARYKRTPKGRATEQKYKHRRRAVEYGVDSEDVTREGLRKIYGDLCHWCEQLMIFDNTGPRAVWASHEHVVPMSKGGTNTWDNSRLSHWSCNNKRNNKL